MMKKCKNSLLLGLALISGLQSCDKITEKNEPCYGVECKKQSKTIEEFMPIYAEQVKKYNAIASKLWPDNKMINKISIVVNMDKTKAWKVGYDGALKVLDLKELKKYPEVVGFDTEFYPFNNVNGESGIILVLNEKALLDTNIFKKYAHLGTYDLFITYVHEGFHIFEQPDWVIDKTLIDHQDRDNNFSNTEARKIRMSIANELLNAFKFPKERDQYILKAMATYDYYINNFKEEAQKVDYFDKIEGTAHYFEVVSCLQVSYDGIKSKEDIIKAYQTLSKKVDITDHLGAGSESYFLGGISGLLLDWISENPNQWKEDVMKSGTLNPIKILHEKYKAQINPKDAITKLDPNLDKKVSDLLQKEQANEKGELSPEAKETIEKIKKEMKEKLSPKEYEEFLKSLETE